MKKVIITLVVLVVLFGGFYIVKTYINDSLYRNKSFYSGNGRIEATEVLIAAKKQNKVFRINVQEGDYVEAKQVLAVMDTNQLTAQLEQAKAKHQQAITAEASARAIVEVRACELEAAKATLAQTESTLKNSKIRYDRQAELLKSNATSQQNFETEETVYFARKAERDAAEANVKQAEANIMVAKADVEGAIANIAAAKAEIDNIQADLDDCYLYAPLRGRIQYRIAEPGEVVSDGGRVLNLVDLTDVYMTFFLPEEIAGKVELGAAVRIVLDAAPKDPIPATITYVASVAQFTPKTVETRIERQKLMFRCKAHINPILLNKYITLVKTGLPGVAWVQLDKNADWPKELQSQYLGAKNKEITSLEDLGNISNVEAAKGNAVHESAPTQDPDATKEVREAEKSEARK